jgi:hypothetical protein
MFELLYGCLLKCWVFCTHGRTSGGFGCISEEEFCGKYGNKAEQNKIERKRIRNHGKNYKNYYEKHMANQNCVQEYFLNF